MIVTAGLTVAVIITVLIVIDLGALGALALAQLIFGRRS